MVRPYERALLALSKYNAVFGGILRCKIRDCVFM